MEMNNEKIINQFIDIIGMDHVKYDNASLLAYSYDSTPQFQALPLSVLSPANSRKVASIVHLCLAHNIHIIARGSGTNLCAGTTPLEGGVIILFNRMNRILEIDTNNLTMTVEPGVITQEIFERANDVNLFYPPDPGSMHISQIGGNISENSGGLR